jgi:hypothetical protein
LRYLQHGTIGTHELAQRYRRPVDESTQLRAVGGWGSLEHLHGAQPSERTFLGLIPIITSTNLTMRIFLSSRLKSRIDK